MSIAKKLEIVIDGVVVVDTEVYYSGSPNSEGGAAEGFYFTFEALEKAFGCRRVDADVDHCRRVVRIYLNP